ncbi:ClpXP protease specificity-enhancing factor [Thiohalomonas denitrificans]|uniref:Stringent starvation protein B n=1 Tax=Thiohalomonas denitrificans TaxID=415747 RepID=A0A1G5PM12_9GAMM|nr:ClpXP protease specificity-enhancing factor [Thiohalomonas denitrificans]SCZ50507.1 stringent starvation protein B [Thiohalomonas denitrificans]
MTPSRPYLLRALYEWILDNGMTPYLLVDAEQENVQVPEQFVENGKIVFNVSPSAIRNLELGNDWVLLDARFSGSPMQVSVPIMAVLAIYARENGKGMVFTDEEGGDQPPPSPPGGGDGDDKPKRPSLKVVK